MNYRSLGAVRVGRYAAVVVLMLVTAILAAPPYSETADAQTSGNDVSFVWSQQFGTSAADGARSVAVDPSDGSPIVAGYTNGTIDPEGAPPGSSLNIQPNLSAGGTDAYVRKHSRSGDWQWTRQFGSSLTDDAFDTATDRQGNTYVAGYGNPANRSQAGAFIVKYTPDGRLATLKDANGNDAPWIRQFNAGRIWTFALDPEGNPYIAVSINSDVYMYKLDSQGNFEASEPFGAYGCYGSGLLDIAFGSAVGRSNDPSVYVTGLTSGQEIDDPNNCEISTGEDELFLIKFDGNLNKKWGKALQFGSAEGSGNAYGVAVDSQDDAYIVGYTTGRIADPDPTDVEFNKGGRDYFVVKVGEYLDINTGKYEPIIEWAEQFGTTGNDLARDVTIDEEDNIYVAGSTDGTFDEGKPNAGGTDGFVGKYDANGTELVIRQFGTVGTDSPQGVAYDAITDSVLVAGNTNGALVGQRDAARTDFDGFLVKVRAENLDAGPPPTDRKTPLIFVPGAAGTQLLYGPEYDTVVPEPGTPRSNPKEKWPRVVEARSPFGGDEYLRDMKLADENVPGRTTGVDPYGDEPEYKTRVGDIIRLPETDLTDVDPIIELQAAGYEERETLFPFPYDWRKDAETTKGGGYHYFGDSSRDMTLPEFIDYVLQETGSSQVDIMAHSLGGLVTLDAMRDPSTVRQDGTLPRSKVRKVMTMGTPVLGATRFYGFVQYQEGCFNPPGDEDDFGCGLEPPMVQESIENFPALYQGIPSQRFHEAEGSPFVDRTSGTDDPKPYGYWTGLGTGLDPSVQIEPEDSVADSRNRTLMENGAGFHENYDDIRAAPFAAGDDIEFVRVIGDSIATVESFVKVNDTDCVVNPGNDCEQNYENRYSDGTTKENSDPGEPGSDEVNGGDGTIPLHSADLYNPARDFDLTGPYPNYYAHNVKHGALVTDDQVINFAVNYFSGLPENPSGQQASASDGSSFFSMRAAYAQEENPQGELVQEELDRLAQESGLDTAPESFAGMEIATSGPVRGYLQDEAGRVLGDVPRGLRESGVRSIPGGDQSFIGDRRSFFLNDARGSFNARLVTTGDEAEDIEVKIRLYEEGVLTGQAIYRLDPPTGSAIRLSLTADGSLNAPELLVDSGADGTVDREVSASSVTTGAAASETEAPTTTLASRIVPPETPRGPQIQQQDGGRGQLRPENAIVTFSASDGTEGSGVADTYYALPGDSEPRRYEGSFEVALGTVVRFASVDGAGNVEPARKVLVDDAPSTLRTSESISSEDRIVRYLDPQGDEDWFSFDADTVFAYRLHLHGLPADYDLTLYNASGTEIAASSERGKRSEEIREKLSLGRYYVKVSGFGNIWSAEQPYHLELELLGGEQEGDG